MSLGTALAVVAFADQCLKYGSKFVKRCQSYCHAQDGTQELLVIIESNWQKTNAQVQFLKKIAPSLPESYLLSQSLVLSQLEGKLKTATHRLDQLIKTKQHVPGGFRERLRLAANLGARGKARYALGLDDLNAIVDDLEKWQSRFDPCWMLILRMESGVIDQELSWPSPQRPHAIITTARAVRDAVRSKVEDLPPQTTWLDAAGFELASSASSLAPLSIVTIKTSGAQALLDTMHCVPMADTVRVTKDVRKLAHVLSKVDPSAFGILQCCGVIQDHETVVADGQARTLPTFSFVFMIPKGFTSRSLRSLLIDAAPHPLNERLDLARTLAQSVLFLHSISFVHKNIRPETVVLLQRPGLTIGAPYLAGFQQFRQEDGHTYMVGTDDFERNLYQHPTRQGICPDDSYRMQHDIYSLGVVLLEIGLWTSVSGSPPRFQLLSPQDEPRAARRAMENKKTLERLATEALPTVVGQKYSHIVLACLQCLDTSEAGFGVMSGANVLDEDGIVIGTRFIEYVLDKFQEICL